MNEKTDVAIVGAGPAGLAAVAAADRWDVNVVVVDGYAQVGGQYFKQRSPELTTDAATAPGGYNAAAEVRQLLKNRPIRWYTGSIVQGISAHPPTLWIQQAERFLKLSASTIVLAAGAYDRPLPFPGWSLPGVITAGAAQTLLKAQGVRPGNKILVAGSGPLLLAVAAALVDAGAEIPAVLEAAPLLDPRTFPWRHWRALGGQGSKIREGWRYLRRLWASGVPIRPGHGVWRAWGDMETGVTGAEIGRLDADGRPLNGTGTFIECDTIVTGFGFLPDTTLSRLAGAAHQYDPRSAAWLPVRDPFLETTVSGIFAAGDGAGVGGARLALIEGEIAGTSAAWKVRHPHQEADLARRLRLLYPAWRRERRFQQLYHTLFTPAPAAHEIPSPETVICRCEGIDQQDVAAAIRQGAVTVSAVKGMTRCGMGSCQGRLCSHLVAGQITRLTGQPPEAAGSGSARIPVHPIPFAAYQPEEER